MKNLFLTFIFSVSAIFNLNTVNARPFPCGFWAELVGYCCVAGNIRIISGPDENGYCDVLYDYHCHSFLWGTDITTDNVGKSDCGGVVGGIINPPVKNVHTVIADYYNVQMAAGVLNIDPQWTDPNQLSANYGLLQNAVVFRLQQAGYNADIGWLASEEIFSCHMAAGPTLPVTSPLIEVPTFTCN